MAEFCKYERHGGICEKTNSYCNLGVCPYENLMEFVPARHGKTVTAMCVLVDAEGKPLVDKE